MNKFWCTADGQIYGSRLTPENPREVGQKSLLIAGVPARHMVARLDKIPEHLEYGQRLKAWASDLTSHIEAGRGAILIGTFGSGKTGSAVALMIEAMAIGSYGFFIKALDLPDIYKSASHNRAAEALRRKLERIQFLIIDDLGASRGSDFGAAQECAERLIRSRYDGEVSTVITSNMDKEEIFEKFQSLKTIFISEYEAIPVNEHNWRDK